MPVRWCAVLGLAPFRNTPPWIFTPRPPPQAALQCVAVQGVPVFMAMGISPSPWIASCPLQTGSALCKLTQGEHDGNCEKTSRKEGDPSEKSCTCKTSSSEEGCTCQEGSSTGKESRSRQKGSSSEEGRTCQEGSSTGKESRSRQEGSSSEEACRPSQEGGSRQEGNGCQEGRSRQGACKKSCTGQEGPQGACPCGSSSSSTDHPESSGSLALPYGQQALILAYHTLNPVPAHRVFLCLFVLHTTRRATQEAGSNEAPRDFMESWPNYAGMKSSV